MNNFHLEILTPERVFFCGDAQSLVVPITDGMLGIMAHREPITASVTVGEAYFTDSNGDKKLFSISEGMIDVQENEVKLLCEYALYPHEIDEAKEYEALQNAKSELAKKLSRIDYKISKMMLNNAINNLKIKQKKSIN